MNEMKAYCKAHRIKVSATTKRAAALLERRGKRMFVDFVYGNAEAKAREYFDFNAEPLSIKILNGQVLRYLRIRKSGWWEPCELVAKVLTETGTMVSDSSITARLRDLRKPRYGAHIIEKRKREGSRAYEYRLAD